MNRLQCDVKGPAPSLFYPVARTLGVSVEELLTRSDLQSEALLAIARDYPVGAVIRMTELWCEAAAFGMRCDLSTDDFPRLGDPLSEDLASLAMVAIPAVDHPITAPLIEAVEKAAPLLDRPLIVGATAPYTLGSVLNGSVNFMVNAMTQPESVHTLLCRLTHYLIDYIGAYKAAGATAVMLCEPSVAMLSPEMTDEFSNRYIEQITAALQDDRFSIIYHNCGAVSPHLDIITQLPVAGFHFGSDIDLSEVFSRLPSDRWVMGNVDPRLFLSSNEAQIARTVEQLKTQYSDRPGFVLSTGCDLSPHARAEAIQIFFNA